MKRYIIVDSYNGEHFTTDDYDIVQHWIDGDEANIIDTKDGTYWSYELDATGWTPLLEAEPIVEYEDEGEDDQS